MPDGKDTSFILYENPKPFNKNDSHSDETESDVNENAKNAVRHSMNCPLGLVHLDNASSIYIKPYSGPRVLGHWSNHNNYELLNEEGNRIFMISNQWNRETSKIYLSNEYEDQEFRKYPVHLSVLNHHGEEVFLFYGRHGKMLIVGPYDTPPWGKVSRRWGWRNWFKCGCGVGPLTYDVHIEKTVNKLIGQPEKITDYLIEGQKTSSCFPDEAARKLYYGGFECKIYPDRDSSKSKSQNSAGNGKNDYDEYIGEMASSLMCEKQGQTLPGAIFNEGLNVYHKCVILGVLLVDIIRN